MKNKIFLLFAAIVFSGSAFAQSINMQRNQSISSTACSGRVYDHGGPSGNYLNSSQDYLYISTASSSIDFTINSLSLESCCDRLYIYDGANLGSAVLVYQGTSATNLSVTINSGNAIVRFSSDGSVVRSGFDLSWTAVQTTAPDASFTTSTVNPLFRELVSFTNTSTNSGSFEWHFGDGNTSTDVNPVHQYTSSGVFNAYLVATACGFASPDTSLLQQISVQAAPTFTINPDTFNLTVNCGQSFDSTLTITNTSGQLNYSLSGEYPNQNPYLLNEGFENGLGAFTSNASYTSFAPTTPSTNAAVGTSYLNMTYSQNFRTGLQAQFPGDSVSVISYHVKSLTTNAYSSAIYFYEEVNGFNQDMVSMRVEYSNLRFFTRFATVSVPLTANSWHFVEFKNIDYTTRTFDIYVDGIVEYTGATFLSTLFNRMNRVQIDNRDFNDFVHYDDIKILKVAEDPINFSSNSGILLSGSNSINFNGSTSGKLAGVHNYNIKLRTNGAGADSLISIPVNVTVLGAADMQKSQACVDFGNVFTSRTQADSVAIYNLGCDTLEVTNIISSNADFGVRSTQFDLLPFDTAYVYIDFNPTTIGSFNDTLRLISNIGDSTICVSGVGTGSSEIETDSLSYTLHTTNCNDSIPFSFYILNTGLDTLDFSINAGGSLFFDDFESSTFNSSLWSSTGSVIIDQNCGVVSGTNRAGFIGTNRNLRTVSINAIIDSVAFHVQPGFGSTNCERPDGGENLNVYAIINGGAAQYIGNVLNFASAGRVSFAVPSMNAGDNVQILISQTNYTGSTYDHYGIDDFELIGTGSNAGFTPSSGTVSVGDSILINTYILTANLLNGTYNRDVNISTNDATDSTFIVPVTLIINGESDLVGPLACLNLGSVQKTQTISDSFKIYNYGCDSATINLITSTNVYANILTDTTEYKVLANDSIMVFLDITGTNVGNNIMDTVFLSSADTTLAVCINYSVEGLPNASFTPDSISTSFTSCNDSSVFDLTLFNIAGEDSLDYKLLGANGSGSSNVVVYSFGASFTERNNVITMLGNLPDVNYVEYVNQLDLQDMLDTSGILIIPEISSFSVYNTLITQDSSIIKAFVRDGNSILYLGNDERTLNNTGIFSSSFDQGYSGSVTVTSPNHPIFAGVSSTSIPNASAMRPQNTLSGTILAEAGSSTVGAVAETTYGKGRALYLGWDYFQYSGLANEIIFNNSIEYLRNTSLPDYISVSPDSGSFAANDSAVMSVQISTRGLLNGTYRFEMEVETNDPLNPLLIIPISFDVTGTPELDVLDVACVSFDSIQQGASLIDTIRVVNVGCDTLSIDSTDAIGSFDLLNLPVQIAPGDTAFLNLEFSPLNVSTNTDTFNVYTNDTIFTICADGDGIGAPILNLGMDTLEVDLNKCKIFKTVQLPVGNTGQGVLSYDMSIGDYEAISNISYNTAGAITTHNFSGVPSSDTLQVRIVVKGDYDDYYERTYINLDGTYNYGYFYDNNLNHVNDTLEFELYGFNVQNFTSDGLFSVRLSNSTSIDGSTGSFHEVYVRFKSNTSWVSISGSTSGTVPINSSVNKNLVFVANTLPVGTYFTSINFATNQAGNPIQKLPVKLNVVSQPEMVLSDTCILYQRTLIGDTNTERLVIYNDGCTPLDVTSILSTEPDVKVNPSSALNIAVGDSAVVMVSFIPTQIRVYNSTLIVSSNDTNEFICVQGLGEALPVAAFNLSIEDPCKAEILCTDNSLNDPTGHLWDFGDGNVSNQKSPTHFYQSAGTYRVKLRVVNAAGLDTTSELVTVDPLIAQLGTASDTVQLNDTISFSDLSVGTPTSWSWNFDDGTLDTTQNPTHVFITQGRYDISLTVSDARGCSETVTRRIRVINSIGIEELSNLNSISLFPNPSKDFVYLEADINGDAIISYELYSSQGKLILSSKFNSNEREGLDLKEYAAGVYYLRLREEGSSEISTMKFVKAAK